MTVSPLTPELSVIDGGNSEPLDEQAANELNEKIRKACSKMATDTFELLTLLEQAATGNIHAALGYPSWTAWFAENVRIDISNRDERKLMAGLMSGNRMSTRAIAKVLGVDQKTISNDLRSGEENSSAGTVDGLDGKIHPCDVGRKPRRQPITDEWGGAVHALTKAVDRLTKTVDCLARISEDNRFTRNRDKLALHRSDLERAITTLQEVTDKFGTDAGEQS